LYDSQHKQGLKEYFKATDWGSLQGIGTKVDSLGSKLEAELSRKDDLYGDDGGC
jgi:hypothetical protein